jgi:uncharacterized protein YkwD
MAISVPHAALRSRLLASLATVFLVAMAGSSSAVAAQACPSASAMPSQAGKRAIVRATLCTINAERSRHGFDPLRLNSRLSRAAAAHAGDMERHNYFSHDSLDGGSFVDRIRSTGYLNGARSWTVGENLAWGSHGRSTPLTITEMWMNSPGHRANILNSTFREIGIGVAHGAPVSSNAPAATYATDFGARR